MKAILLFLFATAVVGAEAFDHSTYDAILRRHVDFRGQVDYASLKADRGSLDAYLARTGAVSSAEFGSWSEAERLAFLINVYNAETLQYIVDNHPVESIKKLGGVLSSAWSRKNVVLHGEEISLDHLEHKIIRKDFDEPRIHFALVCAAKGCPPLRTEAFTGARLESQLADQTASFLADESKNRLESGVLYLSPIFDWYGEDFPGGVAAWVDPWFDADTAGAKVSFTDYDWSLNEQ